MLGCASVKVSKIFTFSVADIPICYFPADCLEEHPAGAISLVSSKANYCAEGEENFIAGIKLFWF
ncbi:hypothetical protein COS33_01465 [Candidatus Wolfebacteria bacterium CG02_land_8_20_14_3_00_37_12]|uniref:Uncharacterized protein n=2 Tax=Candidatus Wolfeibacteriota TaxID=1752735 RepID=A0A2M7Q8V0_9BACT|nr:MAG: hypothetical protein COS33_01465 [Candidatus Wolfebacteria bacterium CG02_land_8_20_14_3_00_37_12]PIY59500.1 MAG: hypothetical protein COY96_01515 [Candidatus Wolfebacteria bacterium CG_4_10_14_0_8_um_filter_37_11]